MKNKSHKDYQEKVNGLWSNLKLFEKGLKQFEGEYFLCFSLNPLYFVMVSLPQSFSPSHLISPHLQKRVDKVKERVCPQMLMYLFPE